MITVMTTMMIEVKTTMMITVMISMMITLIIILMMIRPRRCMQALQKLQHCRRALQKFFLQALQKGGEQINGDEKVVASGPEVIILVITFMLVILLVVM